MNLLELRRKYNTEMKCISYLENTRWKDGIYCLHCNSDKVYKRKGTIKYHCNNCNKDFTVLYGTIFEGSKLPLPKWFLVIALMLNAKEGISAKQIQRNIGGSYKTAWYLCHRIRCAMIETPELLDGIIEMDEAFIGGKPRRTPPPSNIAYLSKVTNPETINKRGRGTSKVPIVGLVSRGKDGKVKTQVSSKLGQNQLLKILKHNVNTKDSIVITDEFKSYANFEKFVETLKAKHSKEKKGIAHTNTIEGYWSILKNGIKGNYKSVSKKYLPFYLTEYAHKYNARNKNNDFELTIDNAVDSEKCMIKFKPKKEIEKIQKDKAKPKAKPIKTIPLKQVKKGGKRTPILSRVAKPKTIKPLTPKEKPFKMVKKNLSKKTTKPNTTKQTKQTKQDIEKKTKPPIKKVVKKQTTKIITTNKPKPKVKKKVTKKK